MSASDLKDESLDKERVEYNPCFCLTSFFPVKARLLIHL